MQATPPCRVTLIRPNRLSTAGLIFERDVETEVPLRLFHKLYRERRRQFDFAPEGIALMMRSPTSDLLPDPAEADEDEPPENDPDLPAEPRADSARSGVKVIRKLRSAENKPVDDSDEAGVDV
jgi:hypothetical protein